MLSLLLLMLKKHMIKLKNIGWGLKERSAIIYYNSHNEFQQTNVIEMYMREGIGGVTELIKNRMVIPYDGSLKRFFTLSTMSLFMYLLMMVCTEDLYKI